MFYLVLPCYYRYFKVLIQEMDLRLDLGFVYAVSELMTPAEVTEKTEVRLKIVVLIGRIRERGGL